MASQKHVKALEATEDVSMDTQLSQVVHRKLKFLLKQIIWNPDYSEVLANCLRVVKNSDEEVL